MVTLGEAEGELDFYRRTLQTAILETLQQRSTPYVRSSFKRIIPLSEDEDIQKRGRCFLIHIKEAILAFKAVITEIQISLKPLFKAIGNEEERFGKWGSK